MPAAVGVIQTLGFPPVLAAADAMLKAARVTLVDYQLAESAQFFIVIRGPISEVNRAMEEGLKVVETVEGGKLINHYIIPNPNENVVGILPIEYSERVDPWR